MSETTADKLAAMAASLMVDAKAKGLTITTLADGSMLTSGTGEELRKARCARLLEIAADIMREVGR